MYVYMLECENGSLYTGIAKNLEKRLTNHGKGSKYTKANKPVKLVYVEAPENAYKREPQIKKLKKTEKCTLLDSPLNIVSDFSHIVVS